MGRATAPSAPPLERDAWDDDWVSELSVRETELVTVGGGFASLALVHLLRVGGVSSSEIRVVGPHHDPAESFRYLARNSQIEATDRLRSDSAARIDGVWGFPGYAAEEALARRSSGPLWRVFAEPLAAEVFTPTCGHVCHGAVVEAERIGWADMAIRGCAIAVRRRREGGFFTVVDDGGRSCSVIRSRYVHLGLGYPALRLTAELQRYRAQHGDGFSCVSAYEPHEHVHRVLSRVGGTVVVRGAGITASRVIERLLETSGRADRPVQIIHLVRRGSRRRPDASDGAWDYQPFNFPKAALGGQLSDRIARIRDEELRAAAISELGGATTARRRAWRRPLVHALRSGTCRTVVGKVLEIRPLPGRGVEVTVGDAETSDVSHVLQVDFLVDCTGLDGSLAADPLVRSLVESGLASDTATGRLRVDRHFEVREARQVDGRLFATGALTLGASVGPVDSFWGLQAAALRVADRLADVGFGERIGVRRSVCGWWRWMRGRPPDRASGQTDPSTA